MSRTYSPKIANVIRKALMDEEWNSPFEERDGQFIFTMGMHAPIKSLGFVIEVCKNHYMIYGMSPVGPDSEDPQQMQRTAEYLTRANYDLKNGCFEMDWRDGEVRYRIYEDCDGMRLSQKVVRNGIASLALTFERYSQGLLNVIFGNQTPEEAIELAHRKALEEIEYLRREVEKELEKRMQEQQEKEEGLEDLKLQDPFGESDEPQEPETDLEEGEA